MKKLGQDPATGLDVTLRSGRFGPYVQLGEAVEGEKPKRAGLPKGVAADDVDLDRALGLLSLPREIGKHPDDGEPIIAGIGRFGPYVQHGKTYANLTTGDDVLTVGLNRAVTLIEEKKAKGPRKSRFGADPGRVARRSSRQGRPDRGEERPLRTLCEPRRGQCHTCLADITPGDGHARAGGRAAGGAGRARRRQEGDPGRTRSTAQQGGRPSRKPRRQPKPPASAAQQAGAQGDKPPDNRSPEKACPTSTAGQSFAARQPERWRKASPAPLN